MADVQDLQAAAALYAAAQLERLGILRVCDRLVELYLRGGLPVGGPAGITAQLDSLWLGRAERLPEDERAELFARTVGPGFEHLLERLAAALADADGCGEDAVAWAADELHAYVDAHVGEDDRAAAALLTSQLSDALTILSDAEILNAYGARDPWELTDQLARLELGSVAPDIARHQTLAAAGAVVIAWLAAEQPEVTEEVADAARSWLAANA
ncbi:MAG: hypothetical protein QOI73_3573 [Solirubrobacteraceae bacterium]|nr:hypothetical protein [Solirubrobacteraceae bacterium]